MILILLTTLIAAPQIAHADEDAEMRALVQKFVDVMMKWEEMTKLSVELANALIKETEKLDIPSSQPPVYSLMQLYWYQRVIALRTEMVSKGDSIVPYLADLLKDKTLVNYSGTTYLGGRNSSTFSELCFGMLEEINSETSAKVLIEHDARMYLIRMAHPSTEDYLIDLFTKDGWVAATARALVRIRTPKTLRAILSNLKNNHYFSELCWALGFDNGLGIKNSSDPAVLDALKEICDFLLSVLNDKSLKPSKREEVAQLLVYLTSLDTYKTSFVNILEDTGDSEAVRLTVFGLLPDNVAELYYYDIAAQYNSESIFRFAANGLLNNKETAHKLCELVASPNPSTSWAAICFLTYHSRELSGRAFKTLVTSLKDSNGISLPNQKMIIDDVIARNNEAIEALKSISKDREINRGTREYALEIIARKEHYKTSDTIGTFFKEFIASENDPYIIKAAVEKLRKVFYSPYVVIFLADIIADNSFEDAQRRAVSEALYELLLAGECHESAYIGLELDKTYKLKKSLRAILIDNYYVTKESKFWRYMEWILSLLEENIRRGGKPIPPDPIK